MKKYNVSIKESLKREVSIEANSKEDALRKIKKKYDAEEIILDSFDFLSTEFEVV